uniref:Cadherin domain-containing protein n=1 Tax=Macrostomum lignano TaxID=282301 RepID=A0A1I8F478_9PLAT
LSTVTQHPALRPRHLKLQRVGISTSTSGRGCAGSNRNRQATSASDWLSARNSPVAIAGNFPKSRMREMFRCDTKEAAKSLDSRLRSRISWLARQLQNWLDGQVFQRASLPALSALSCHSAASSEEVEQKCFLNIHILVAGASIHCARRSPNFAEGVKQGLDEAPEITELFRKPFDGKSLGVFLSFFFFICCDCDSVLPSPPKGLGAVTREKSGLDLEPSPTIIFIRAGQSREQEFSQSQLESPGEKAAPKKKPKSAQKFWRASLGTCAVPTSTLASKSPAQSQVRIAALCTACPPSPSRCPRPIPSGPSDRPGHPRHSRLDREVSEELNHAVLLTVMDVNDNPPVFEPSAWTSACRGHAGEYRIAQLRATSRDAGLNALLRYRLMDNDALFSVDAMTHCNVHVNVHATAHACRHSVSLKSHLDYESSRCTLTVTAFDSAPPRWCPPPSSPFASWTRMTTRGVPSRRLKRDGEGEHQGRVSSVSGGRRHRRGLRREQPAGLPDRSRGDPDGLIQHQRSTGSCSCGCRPTGDSRPADLTVSARDHGRPQRSASTLCEFLVLDENDWQAALDESGNATQQPTCAIRVNGPRICPATGGAPFLWDNREGDNLRYGSTMAAERRSGHPVFGQGPNGSGASVRQAAASILCNTATVIVRAIRSNVARLERGVRLADLSLLDGDGHRRWSAGFRIRLRSHADLFDVSRAVPCWLQWQPGSSGAPALLRVRSVETERSGCAPGGGSAAGLLEDEYWGSNQPVSSSKAAASHPARSSFSLDGPAGKSCACAAGLSHSGRPAVAQLAT